MMGISSSSENEEEDKDSFSSWDTSSTSSESSNKSAKLIAKGSLEPLPNRATDAKLAMDTVTDLRVLFNDSSLKSLASVINRDDVQLNVLQHHQSKILSWLLELNLPMSESVITQEMFCDFLVGKGVNREDAIKAFSRFDTEGNGKADAELVQDEVNHPYEEMEEGELSYCTRILQRCSSLPGFVDVFSKTDPSSKHATKLLNFLIRNRASASNFRLQMLVGFEDTVQLRRTVGNAILARLEKEIGDGEEVKLLCGDNSGDVKSTGRPYSSIEVSSNPSDAHKLTDGNIGSWWQSDGAARSHYIRLNMKKNVVIKQLFLYLTVSDQSYMPHELVLSVGRKHSLRDIKEMRVPASANGPVLVIENLKVYYPVVQINIKRCHSDGCDTRIRMLKVSGLRVMKEAEMTVRDASVKWFFQLTTATALSSAQVLPAYREILIKQAQEAFRFIPPMSLCQGNSERPKFLTEPIIGELKKFIDTVTGDDAAEVSDDSLLCKISYGLAACDLAGIISVISYLLDNAERKIVPGYMMTSMESVKAKYWAKGEKLLPLTFIDCDGGERQMDGSGYIQAREVINYDSANYTDDAYSTKKGRTKFTMLVEASESVQITRIRIRPEKGNQGVKCGMIFLLPLAEAISSTRSSEDRADAPAAKKKSSLSAEDQKALYKRLEKYDDWTLADYEAYKTQETQPDGVLAYFTIHDDPDDWDELEMVINERLAGQIMVMKFLRPRSASSEKIGVVGVNIFGYDKTSDYFPELDYAEPSAAMNSLEFCGHILSFIVVIIKSLENKQPSGSKLPYVDFSGLNTVMITDLFNKARRLETVSVMRKILRICHCIFINWVPGKEDSDGSLLFDTFSSIINGAGDFEPSVVAVARAVIVDGAKAFFPNDQVRKEQLLRLLKDINQRADGLASTSLVFESLCQFFSDVEPSALLNLPKPSECISNKDTLEAIDTHCLEVMDTLIYVTLHKSFNSTTQRCSSLEKHSPSSSLFTLSSGVAHSVLVKLLSCLQTGFFAWINAMRNTENSDLVTKSKSLLLSYVEMAVSHFSKFTDTFLELTDDQLSSIFTAGDEFVFSTMQQLVVFLSEYCKSANSVEHNLEIVKVLWPFVGRMKQLRDRMPNQFIALDSDHWSKVQTELQVLNMWTEESPHNYNNNQNTTKVFNCPGAKLYILEFDPRCHTERKYDYLEFNNYTGMTHKYDQRVGSDTWPLKVDVRGSKLQFVFHSDQSNNEWGYKFTVTAKGIPEAPIDNLFDLHLSLSLLLGQVCGQAIFMQPAVAKLTSSDVEEDNELVMLRSNLWKTLFRAGYQPTDKLERSLSGRYIHGCFDNVKGFLLELLSDSTASPYRGFLSHLRSRCKHYQAIGTPEISSAVLYTFAAFVYHTNDICESMSDYIGNGEEESVLVEGVYQAYNLAEHIRLPLILLRQKAMEQGDASDFTQAKEMIEKANLLLRFAALTKSSSVAKCVKTSKPRKGSARKAVNHDLLKRLEGNIPERYGQFRLVLEFIVEPSWNCIMVENAIQDRVKKSKLLCMAYQWICDYLTSSPNSSLLQIDNILFLRAVLNSQKLFPTHYADSVDGCGLEQESKLRHKFYTLIRLLVKSATSQRESSPSSNVARHTDTASSIIQSCLLHLLDMEWRENDLMFLKEINLPRLFFDASKDNVAVRERVEHPTDEKEEMTVYERDKSWYTECHDSFSKWYGDSTAANKNKQDVQMFIARHCDLMEVEIYCDGCRQTMPGRRYRCLDCTDMDLCVTCFTGGVNPGGSHKDGHSFVYLMYKCDICQAFISGERVHCKVCDDFDLCYGCYKTKKTQTGHEAQHDVCRYPQTRLKSSSNANKLSSYIHQHAWLQFAQLTLAMSGAVFEQHGIRSEDSTNEDYVDTAAQLLSQCLSLITDSLQKVSTVSSQESADYQEEVFVLHSQERIMGLLGAIISLDEQCDAELNTFLTTTDFLGFIFYIASGQGGYGQHSTVQHLALGLLAQLMQKSAISTQATDEAVLRTLKRSVAESEDHGSGVVTIEFLIQAASSCLEKQQGVDWSYSLIRLLQQLVHTSHWSDVMKRYLVESATTLKETMSLELVLCLFVLTGFPEIKSPGVPVKYLDFGSDEKKAVILKHFPDRMQSMVIDSDSRKRKMVKDQLIERTISHPQFYDDNIMSLITQLIVENSSKLMKGAWLDIETHWVLCLSLKAFDQFVTALVPYENLDVIRSLVNLAGMGTRLSKLWLVSDLEILSLMLYIKLGNNMSSGAIAKHSAQNPALPSKPSSEPTPAATEDAFDPFPDMDGDSKKHFMVLLEMLNIPAGRLREVYHDHKESPSLLMHALHGLLLEDSPEKAKLQSKSTLGGASDKQNPTERMIDFGILPTAAQPRSESECMESLEAVVDEKAAKKNTAKPSSSCATDEKRSSSAKLLKLELSNMQQKSPSHVHLNKVNIGLSIMYARQALATILAKWSVSGPKISAELLNCEEHNLALILDVLNRDTTNLKQFEKVVAKVMSCCKKDYLQSVADSASYFMDEVKTKKSVRESPHQKFKAVKGKVEVKGASVLVVSFDKCCNTSNDSRLDISTSADMKKNHRKLFGPREKWNDFELPGDTLYFTYQPAASGPSKWKFAVTSPSNSSGSFFTGFVILNHILSTPSYCRIIDAGTMWRRLIVIACKQPGAQRLKAIQLLLYLLKSHIKGDDTDFDGPTELKMDLKYLAPLWRLYKTMSEDQGAEQTSPLLRALTELFFIAENVAMQWNVVGEFMSCMIDPTILQSSVMIGLQRVLAVSAATDYDCGFSIPNQATVH